MSEKNLIVMKRVQPRYGAERDYTQMKREKKIAFVPPCPK